MHMRPDAEALIAFLYTCETFAQAWERSTKPEELVWLYQMRGRCMSPAVVDAVRLSMDRLMVMADIESVMRERRAMCESIRDIYTNPFV